MPESTPTPIGSDQNRQKLNPVRGIIAYPWLGAPEVVYQKQQTTLVIAIAKGTSSKVDSASMKKVVAPRLKFFDKNQIVTYLGRQGGSVAHAPIPEDLIESCKKIEYQSEHQIEAASRSLRGRLEPVIAKNFLAGFDLFEVVLKDGLRAWLKDKLKPYEHAPDRLTLFAVWLPKGEPSPIGPEPNGEEFTFERVFRNDGKPIFLGARYIELMDKSAKTRLANAKALQTLGYPLGIYPFDPFDAGDFVFDRPVAPYHPITFYDRPSAIPGVLFLSDIHVVSRLEMLAKSDFRLVPPLSESESPRIGSLINSHGRAFQNLLGQGGIDGAVDCMALGGDLVDFSCGFFGDPGSWTDNGKVKDSYWRSEDPLPWETVHRLIAIDTSKESTDRYQRGTDALACFKLILDCLLQYGKPIFILAGNHDSYDKPFGVYPMVAGEKARTNVNIPADANLTIMEARLLHGETATALLKLSNFIPQLRQGFQYLFNPFISFTSQVGNAQWIVMGWGDDENILGPHVGHTIGHLPVAEKDVTTADLEVFAYGADFGKPDAPVRRSVWFMSHYTLVSYVEDVLNSKQGEIPFDTWMPFSNAGGVEYNVGTFHEGKPQVWDRLFKCHIDVALSGHSHRFGIYRIDQAKKGVEYVHASNSVKVRGNSSKANSSEPVSLPKSQFPLIIVNDASGPLPRRNDLGEFKSYGRDNPAGTRVVLKADKAEVSVLRAKSSNALPRLATEIDGWSVLSWGTFEFSKPWVASLEAVFANLSDLKAGTLKATVKTLHHPEAAFSVGNGVIVATRSNNPAKHFKMSFRLNASKGVLSGDELSATGILSGFDAISDFKSEVFWKEGREFSGWLLAKANGVSGTHIQSHSIVTPQCYRVTLKFSYQYGFYSVKVTTEKKWNEFPDLKKIVQERRFLKW